MYFFADADNGIQNDLRHFPKESSLQNVTILCIAQTSVQNARNIWSENHHKAWQ